MAYGRKKRIQAVFLAAFLPLILGTLCRGEEKTLGGEEQVARVNGTVITRKALDREMARVQRSIVTSGRKLSAADLPRLQQRVLESLIDREILYQEGRKKGFRAEEAEVNDQIASLKKKYSTETEYQAALKRVGLNEGSLRKEIEKGLVVKAFLIKEFKKKITISDEETKAFYDANPRSFTRPEQVRASHILVKVGQGATEAQRAEAQKKIEEIRQRIKKGEDFASLAREYSDCPSKVKGGDLSYFARGQMVKPFEDAAFSLKVGQVSGVVETRFGYHLIKVTDRRPELKLPYEKVKEKVRNYLASRKMTKEVQAYVNGLKKHAKVERNL